MLFLSVPRQAGKRTLARMIAEVFPNRLYFNWDIIADNNGTLLLVEVNRSDDQPSKGLRKFQHQLGVPAVQLVDSPGVYKLLPNGGQSILVVDIRRWLSGLP